MSWSSQPSQNFVSASSERSAGQAASKESGRARRVLHHVATTVPGTGVDTFVLQLCAAQQRLGVTTGICCNTTDRAEFVATAERLGIPVHAFPSVEALPAFVPRKARTAYLVARRTADLARFVARERFDVVHVHAVSLFGLEAHLATALSRVPLIVTHHSTLEWWRPMWTLQSDVILQMEKWRTTFAVCPYQKAADELRDAGIRPERLVVIPFCADEKRFSGSITPPKPGEPFHLIIPARLVAEKGYAELLTAMAEVRGRLPQVRLTIVGTGPAQAEIEQTIGRLGLGDIVKMLGYVPHADMPELLRKCHVIVLPSYMGGETFPVALLEGMCMGMPAIGTRWFGIPDIIEDGVNGVLVEPRDAKALARAIEALAGDLTFFARASEGAARRALREFTGESVARRYAELYERAAAQRKG
jgi:glycosyltransferase involved in cell wall biosynthesis